MMRKFGELAYNGGRPVVILGIIPTSFEATFTITPPGYGDVAVLAAGEVLFVFLDGEMRGCVDATNPTYLREKED